MLNKFIFKREVTTIYFYIDYNINVVTRCSDIFMYAVIASNRGGRRHVNTYSTIREYLTIGQILKCIELAKKDFYIGDINA